DSSLMKFVGYVSPYLVVSNGGRYTKHIYAGTQRIASKLGDIEAFGADPRRVEKAGADIRDIDFGKKYAQQNDSLSSRYDQLGAMNKPEINEDYVGGQSFCCGDKPLAELPQNAGNSENAQFEENIYFYHPDHLGSTSMVTNIDGEITQNVVYIPYGEVFVEERNGAWSSPYLFNAKELDEETGLYYYGARYLDPTSARWLSVDPMFERNIDASPYNYCHENPIQMQDPNGMDDYGVGSNGEIAFIKETDEEKDRLIAGVSIDRNGNLKKDKNGEIKGLKYNDDGTLANKEIKVTKGIFTKKNTTKTSVIGGHLYKANDLNEATDIFKFLANETKVEWGFFNKRYTDKGSTSEHSDYFLSTSHEYDRERLSATIVVFDAKSIFIDFHYHSHPEDFSVSEEQNAKPSNYDMDFAYKVLNSSPKVIPIFKIYTKRIGDFGNNYLPK
ncbi:MAG: hypothetical protein J6Y37_12435, partial [Paludibacteraceae bacterium]|nr:hypothetical protein [Paludibacteraceae bacterium]